MDLVERDAEGHLVLVDLKTADRTYTGLQVSGALQLRRLLGARAGGPAAAAPFRHRL